MTGWTQATARFVESNDAAQAIDSAKDAGCRYAEREDRIVRVRKVGYEHHDTVVKMLKDSGNIELALVADFNDTTESGYVTVYRPNRMGWQSQGKCNCPEVMRRNFRVEIGGLVETGTRAGNDFSLDEQYGERVTSNEQTVLDNLSEASQLLEEDGHDELSRIVSTCYQLSGEAYLNE